MSAADLRTHRIVRAGASLAAVLVAIALVVLGGPAMADGTASIDHVEPTKDGKLSILLSVPGVDTVDLASVKVAIDGTGVSATAQSASASSVRRTAILAIDTSDSMAGTKFNQAKSAALSYLDAVPSDVYVGIVTFDKQVRVAQAPTQDRTVARTVIGTLALARGTALNQGVQQAVSTAGTKGGRTVLVLSDGQDTTKSALATVLQQVKSSGTKVDVVALKQSGAGLTALTQIADAGQGSILSANDPAVLTRAFQAEAQTLTRQVLVTADVPVAKATSGNIDVSITAGNSTWSSTAFARIRNAAAKTARGAAPVAVAASGVAISSPLMLGGLAAIGLGVVGIVLAFAFGGKAKPKTDLVGDQIAAYGNSAAAHKHTDAKAAGEPSLKQVAKQRAAAVLANNRGLEAKIAHRLEGSGMALKPAEWLLVHGGVAIGGALFFLLITGGNPIFALVGLIIAAVLPWVYLGLKRSRRMKAFQSALPDTLQLMAGSLSAGLSLAQSMDTIVREGTEPITSEFKRVTVESRLGVGLEDAMEGVAERMDSKDFGWVVMAIRIQREVGGNLSELLLTVAETLREREYIRRHVRALSAEGRLSCYVLGGLPPVFLLYLSLSKWDYVAPLFTTPIGFVLLGAMVTLLSVGIVWMAKVSKVEL